MNVSRRGFVSLLAAAGAMPADSAGGMALSKSTFNSLPSAGSFDVVVVGGSCTGVFAALRAAETGLRVALIEMSGGFGGTATQGLVPVWHSLYSSDGKRKIIGGLTDEVIEELVRRGEARKAEPGNPGIGTILNVAGLQLLLDERVRAMRMITPMLHTRVAATVGGDGRIEAVVIADKSGLRTVRGSFFIDATGDADLCRFTPGFKVWRLPKEKMQAHTVCAILSGVDRVKAKHPGFSCAEILKAKYGAGVDHRFGWNMPVIGSAGLTFHAYSRVLALDPSCPEDLTRIEMECRSQVRRLVDAANRAFPMPQGEGISIVSIAAHAGLRESCHIEGLYRLKTEDILHGRRFPDAIAKGSYRVDIHEGAGNVFRYLDGREQRMEKGSDGEMHWVEGRWREPSADAPTWYEIPFRSIVPKGSVNVLAPGRALDCERDGYGACRVMVNCNQMGEAAGRAAALALSRGVPVSNVCECNPPFRQW